MPLDGTVVAAIAHEISELALNGRIDKIHQPENDEIILGIRGFGRNSKLLLSANSSNPRLHFTNISKENPKTAPLFCMVLRKHLANGKILSINQPDFERIVEITVESLNEMGDASQKRLIIEIMGKHSNIILVDENGIILDSAKHVSFDKSSVRQVLPGKEYFYPPSQNKLNPSELKFDSFVNIIKSKPGKLQEAIYKNYSGISPLLASEICHRAGVDYSKHIEETAENEVLQLFESFENIFRQIKASEFSSNIYYEENGKIVDFAVVELTMLKDLETKEYADISSLLEDFYLRKDTFYRNNQKTLDLRKLVGIHIDRTSKKKDILLKTLDEIAGRDDLRLKGELITANIYSIISGLNTVSLVNFYDENGGEIEISLDPTLSPADNAQKYFKKYNKQKRTYDAVNEQLAQTDEDLYYLESVLNSLEGNLNSQDISDIRKELREQGFIKKSATGGKKEKASKSGPMAFVSSDGFEIFVGKNNRQNDELTLNSHIKDLWLHTKSLPGSHVIIRAEGKEIPNSTIEEAANLAAFFSKGRNSTMVAVDYTIRKNVKKPNGAKPGMVIYDVYNTAFITPDIKVLERINKNNEIF